ncbi:MAG TPA: helix-turn-helix domain-containing protein [Thermoanaerobaculia bacterium]|nr:helix-turn-helix domain-containing protein [Thermoanaerobaculia bacterium]
MEDEKPEEKLDDLAARLEMLLLRQAKGMDQAELAREAGISAGQASNYEQAKAPVRRKTLEKVAGATDFPASLLGFLHRGIRSFLLVSEGRSRADRALTEVHALERLAFAREAADLILAPRTRPSPAAAPPPRAADRETFAAPASFFLEGCTAAEGRLLAEEAAEYQSWVLAEAAAFRSVREAPNHPREAREWARLAVYIAELVSGEEDWRSCLQGWALHFLANAARACSDLPAAEEALARGSALWQSGAPGSPGLLAAAWLPWVEASLRKDQRRFPEALERIDEALALDRGELRAQILLSKSNTLRRLDDPQGSTAVLLEAERWIDAEREPRLAFGVRFNLLADLCALGRAAEAAPRLPGVRTLAEQLGEPLDLTRCLWLQGQIDAGLGRPAEALAAFRQVRRDFLELPLPYDHALASLDLSLVLLEEGRTAEVRTVAEEMLAIFKAQGVGREALAALRVFCEAARQEAATVEMARQVARFLRRAQLDPELRFVEEGAR